LVILVINSPTSFSSWCFCNIVSDTSVLLSSFKSLKTLKVSRSANFGHMLQVNGSLPIMFLVAFPRVPPFSFSFGSRVVRTLSCNLFPHLLKKKKKKNSNSIYLIKQVKLFNYNHLNLYSIRVGFTIQIKNCLSRSKYKTI